MLSSRGGGAALNYPGTYTEVQNRFNKKRNGQGTISVRPMGPKCGYGVAHSSMVASVCGI